MTAHVVIVVIVKNDQTSNRTTATLNNSQLVARGGLVLVELHCRFGRDAVITADR